MNRCGRGRRRCGVVVITQKRHFILQPSLLLEPLSGTDALLLEGGTDLLLLEGVAGATALSNLATEFTTAQAGDLFYAARGTTSGKVDFDDLF